MQRRLHHHWTFIGFQGWVVAVIVGLLASQGFSQSPRRDGPLAEKKSDVMALQGPAVAGIFEREARRVIERHIPAEEFQVIVSVKTKKESGEAVPYMPTGGARILADKTSLDDVLPFVQKIDLEVLLTARFKSSTKKQLQDLLEKKLYLDRQRGDSVTFRNLTIEIDRPVPDLQRALVKVEQDGRELSTKLDLVTRERDDAKRDLALAKAEADRLTRMTLNQPKGRAVEGWKSFVADNVPLLGVVAFLIAGMLAQILNVRTGARALGTAIRALGDHYRSVGDRMIEAEANRGSDAVLRAAIPVGESRPQPALGSAHPSANVPLAALHEHIVTLRQEILAVMNDAAESLIVQYLGQLLMRPASLPLAVVTMELLGQEKANTLFHRLGPDQQTLVWDFLKTGHYGQPKAQFMLEAGEELKTKLMASAIGGVQRRVLNDKVAAIVASLKIADLVQLTESLSEEVLPRFFLYLEPVQLGAILTELRMASAERLASMTSIIPQIAAMERRTALDEPLLHALNAQMSKVRAESQRGYLGYYRALVESVDEELGEQLVADLGRADPEIDRFMRDQVVTFRTFLMLQDDLMEEILNSMINKDLGALLVGLDQATRAKLTGLMGGRRGDLLKDEIARLEGRGGRHLLAAHRLAKRWVVHRMLEIKGTEPLTALLKETPESLEPSERTDQNAA